MLDINQIKEIIPHRYPFLLVDKIIKLDLENNEVIGLKCVSANEEFFNGHFPQMPIMPGVLIVEALAQTGAVMLLSAEENKGKIAYFAGINKISFVNSVFPGDVLELNVKFTKSKFGIHFADVVAKVDSKIVCKGEIMCAVK